MRATRPLPLLVASLVFGLHGACGGSVSSNDERLPDAGSASDAAPHDAAASSPKDCTGVVAPDPTLTCEPAEAGSTGCQGLPPGFPDDGGDAGLYPAGCTAYEYYVSGSCLWSVGACVCSAAYRCSPGSYADGGWLQQL